MNVVEVNKGYNHTLQILTGIPSPEGLRRMFLIYENDHYLSANNELIRKCLLSLREQEFDGALGDRVIIDRSTEPGNVRDRADFFRNVCQETGIEERYIVYASQNPSTAKGAGEFPAWIFLHEFALRMADAYKDVDLGRDIDRAERKVLCMNNKTRPHRIATVLAAEKILGDDLLFSWEGYYASFSPANAMTEWARDFPETAAYDTSILTSKSTVLEGDSGNMNIVMKMNVESSERCFLHLVCETDYMGWSTRFTEKVLKPMACRRPFLVMGPAHMLKSLKSLGFRTFSEIFDESYDDVIGHQDRLNKLMASLKDIYSRDHIEVLRQCKDVCEHNNDLLRNGLSKRILDTFESDLLGILRWV